MKAAVYKAYGLPEVLSIAEVATPKPTSQQVLIKVIASSVNRSDCAMLTAKPFIMRFGTGLYKPKNPILGTEFLGEVVEKGAEVSEFEVGDRVFGFDDKGVSAYAEYMVFDARNGIATLPQGFAPDQLAGCIEGMHYAYNFINKVKLHRGDRVMINGATGAIGSAMVQLMKYYKADITATADTKNIDLIKSLGAHKVIDYTKEDFTQLDEKFDLVFDTVGKSSFGKCKRLLKPKGTYISSELGKGSQNVFLSLITPLLPGKTVGFPLPVNIKRSVLLVKRLIEEGHYRPVIDKTFPLEDIQSAFGYVLTGKKTGNVVLKVKN